MWKSFESFLGGIHPKDGKELAAEQAIESMPVPGEVVIPLSQHIGAPCAPVVKVGDQVKRGQLIATTDAFMHGDIHASVSGTVKKIEDRPHSGRITCSAIVIESDGEDAWADGLPLQRDWKSMSREEILGAVQSAGIVGMGHTGKLLAERLHALGMNIIAYNRSEIQGMDYITRKLSSKNGDTLDPLLAEADFIILTIALTDETFHLFNKETFAKVKKGACLINMARGGIVCTEDLIEALNDGTLSGAGLDVFEEQPLSPDSPLWHMPMVYITPHSTPQVPDRQAATIEIIRENARRFEAGEPLLNLMRPSDAVSGEANAGGWARMMNSGLSKEQIAKMPLEKYLGKRGWTDPSEWM